MLQNDSNAVTFSISNQNLTSGRIWPEPAFSRICNIFSNLVQLYFILMIVMFSVWAQTRQTMSLLKPCPRRRWSSDWTRTPQSSTLSWLGSSCSWAWQRSNNDRNSSGPWSASPPSQSRTHRRHDN